MTLLPQPELADNSERLAGPEVEVGAIHGAHDAFVLHEMRRQVAHRQDGARGGGLLSHRGPQHL